MRNFILFTGFLAILLYSCNGKKGEDQTIPEAFQDDKALSDWSSLKRGYMNIVDQLYEDLCKKDEALKKIEEGIKTAMENDRLKTEKLRVFFSDNENYYQTALSVTEQITDSIMKQGVIQKLNTDRDRFLELHQASKMYLDSLQKKTEALNNLHIVLKIQKTMPEIRKYQSSFSSDTLVLKQVIKEYDLILERIESKIKE